MHVSERERERERDSEREGGGKDYAIVSVKVGIVCTYRTDLRSCMCIYNV